MSHARRPRLNAQPNPSRRAVYSAFDRIETEAELAPNPNSLLQNTPGAQRDCQWVLSTRAASPLAERPPIRLETEVFAFFQALPADMKSILSCSVNSFDGITSDERNSCSTHRYRRSERAA